MQVYLNGEILEKEKALISPFERSFLFGDGVYEVIRYYPNKFFRADLHLERLQNSLNSVGIKYSNLDEIIPTFNKLMILNNLIKEVSIGYVQISRGEHFPRRHFFDDEIKPTVFMYVEKSPAKFEEMQNGIKVGLEEDIRWMHCNIKAIALLPNILTRNRAIRKGLNEIIWHKNGIITEGTQTNIFIVKNEEVITPPLSNFILPGVTRKIVLELCNQIGIKNSERNLNVNELDTADEIFITSTTAEITPVVEISGTKIKNLEPGRISRILQKEFSKLY